MLALGVLFDSSLFCSLVLSILPVQYNTSIYLTARRHEPCSIPAAARCREACLLAACRQQLPKYRAAYEVIVTHDGDMTHVVERLKEIAAQRERAYELQARRSTTSFASRHQAQRSATRRLHCAPPAPCTDRSPAVGRWQLHRRRQVAVFTSADALPTVGHTQTRSTTDQPTAGVGDLRNRDGN